ncbi:MAG TPA: Coenzyme F420 hydrogenase/dehydrogenase, beta subunit C-terminal domain [Candidatus Omnitrophota bacterium]|nr:Coenzyme F420 hydrogenase/dehydrogenase, beta subunit C-terminal domain [Candidatus Omnitrophota bacterium]HRZ14110.1 Coenzyme F420 hydrogenase/dehydrogenase, beta subunit C-terminal domain [Candidatus Omnitrophota bacterium]
MKTNSVFDRLSKAMCCGCGVCAGICPTQAITIRVTSEGINYPVLDTTKCIFCGKCQQVCPGFGFDHKELNISIFGQAPENALIGNFQAIYKGYSGNGDLRFSCSSGGLVTTMSIELLRNKVVDGVVVTRLKYGREVRAEAFIASTEEEIFNAKGSKYCPVSLDKAIIELKRNPRKVAVVCLPCHAIALRKAMSHDKVLKESIVLILALFCNQAPSYRALSRYLKKHKVSASQVTYFQWRGDGWPGKTKIKVDNQHEISELSTDAWATCFGSGYFTPLACYCCQDFFGDFSDISFGDAWLPEQKGDTIGTNVMIIRSDKGKQIVDGLVDAKKIHADNLRLQAILNAFTINTRTKRICYPLHANLIGNCPGVTGMSVLGAPSCKVVVKEFIRLVKLFVGVRLHA